MAEVNGSGYLDPQANVDWSELQRAHKRAQEEMLKLQEKQNQEFVELHGIPARSAKDLDAVILSYGWKAVQKHLDKKMVEWCKIKDLTDEELSKIESNFNEMRPGKEKDECAVELEARKAEKAERARISEMAKSSISDFEDTVDLGEPVIETKTSAKVTGARRR